MLQAIFFFIIFYITGASIKGGGGQVGDCSPDFGRIVGAAGQRQRTALLLRILQEIILGTSDAWSTIRLSHLPSNPAYHILNWLILILKIVRFTVLHQTLKMNHSKTIIEFSLFMYASLPLLLENRETRTIVMRLFK
jgi:hypothetical protein